MQTIVRMAAILGLTILVPATGTIAQPIDAAALMTPGPLGDKTLGDPNAPVAVIEYASLTCSHCGNFHRTTFGALKEKYIDTGKVHFVLREFPLDQLALAAAMVARCAPEEDYFSVVDSMFTDQNKWAYVEQPGAALLELVKPHGFTEETFRACLNDEKLLEGIVAVAKRGDDLGVTGTPAFFVNGENHGGEMTIEQFDAVLEPLLTGN